MRSIYDCWSDPLYGNVHNRLLNALCQRTQRPEDAEDALQWAIVVFLEKYGQEKPSRFTDKGALGYVYVTARNRLIDQQRSAKRRKESSNHESDALEQADPLEPAHEVAVREEAERILAELAALDQHLPEAAWMRANRMSYRQITIELGLPYTARTLCNRFAAIRKSHGIE